MVYILSFIVSGLIAILFLKINIKENTKSLISSYSNSTKIMLDLNNNSDNQQDAMFKELKHQFKLLIMLMVKFLVMLSPIIIIIVYAKFTLTSIDNFLNTSSFIISIGAFLMVYLFKKYGKSQ
jgi:uncharacterized membrane protein (DUF485 family)